METELWGRKIRAFRKLKGYTQGSLSQELDISVSVLGAIERGNRVPTDELVRQIADILEVTVTDLMPEDVYQEKL